MVSDLLMHTLNTRSICCMLCREMHRNLLWPFISNYYWLFIINIFLFSSLTTTVKDAEWFRRLDVLPPSDFIDRNHRIWKSVYHEHCCSLHRKRTPGPIIDDCRPENESLASGGNQRSPEWSREWVEYEWIHVWIVNGVVQSVNSSLDQMG